MVDAEMASRSNLPSTGNASNNGQNSIYLSSESPSRSVGNKDEGEEYDEDEDVDFNPFLKGTPSPAASSSLSSEIEAFEGETDNTQGNDSINSMKPSCVLQNLDGRGDDRNGEEEIAVQSNVSSEEPRNKDSQKNAQRKCKMKNYESLSCTEGDNLRDNESNVDVMVEMNENGSGMSDMSRTQKSMLNLSEEDAICMRTRARYSLASITLDELEAFLQETDDEDDIQNVNDEEEYQKFLAAVLLGGHDEGSLVQKHENSDDDDEDNDADFEIELEEALESDDEEGVAEKVSRSENSSTSRRPATRQNRQQNIPIQRKRSSPDQAKRLLRPLVPILPTGPIPFVGRHSVSETIVSGNSLINGFTQTQIGQLRSLILDHVQLLIQVYSISVLDPSRQHISTQVHGLITEILCKREESVSCQSQPHSCVTRPSTSILDVSPLDLASGYLDDVSSAVRDYRRCQVESGCDASSDRVPLFPLSQSVPCQGVGGQVLNSSPASTMGQSSPGQQQPKKTLAATLVESAKKQSVALVHKDIAKLAQRFYSLFNPSLFPHKPPPAAVANRVLFTDAEDELLALGIMECNSDWKAIQQRFLPCKSKHQIFVRQKNRCSSKALENPIKAVRRMKSSPLTAEETSRIQEGLKYFKFDWMSVWKFIVPHRDPALLPRQWRIALGVQKSYKQDDAKKEKRRLYELKRKSRASLTNEQPVSNKDYHGATNDNENNIGDVDNLGEAYVHKGFLADWRPDVSHLFYSRPLDSLDKEKNVHDGSLKSVEEIQSGDRSENLESNNAQLRAGNVQRFSPTLMRPDRSISGSAPGASRPQIILRPYRARRFYNSRVVRLAPELPPVNLPPSVRVISQSVFSKNQPESSKPHNVRGGIFDVSGRGNLSSQPPRVSANEDQSCPPNVEVPDLRLDKLEAAEDISNMDSDFQMHPLLFRIPENGQLTCYSLSSQSGGSSSFSFFSDHRPQLLSLFNSPRQVNLPVDQLQRVVTSDGHDAASGDIGFHPLLQRVVYPNNSSTNVGGTSSLSVGIKGKSGQLEDASVSVKKTSTSNVGLVGVGSQPSSSGGKAKTVDLDIHLSSSSSKVKGFCRDSAENTSEAQNICAIQHDPANYCKHRSEVYGTTVPGDDISRCIDEIGDNSNIGIVMEQEELSDSDEEMEEENVEFECEEMADSEGEEGSECEEIIGMQDKDHPSSAVEKTRTVPDAGSERGLENLTSSRSKISDLSVVGLVSSRSSAAELGKDSRSSPWLSLELESRSICRKPGKQMDAKTSEELANETVTALSSPSRSCKKRIPAKRRGTESKEDVGIARLLSLGPLATPTAKKPRNRVFRAKANVDIGTSQETSRCNDKDRACSS
ncbi:PREDICTED: uncharacterized protein LOC104812970 [Tarenaya hassleriana]|uniref:uncharacterized protein LOC104812970 n=1 Tax=Tarenaya hassleriana TaxID=28532 RepID=UPI00053C2FF6|nr:PREDICTED: uncharacterized protein LOC104812970 [Tarenaya hassleriana]XP_010538711.1 PREDICTED: uncharacterized protein LOC104812970 [Tarenaya hassleriana]XP_010538712.1 PREDICTED: uncharacterized protein LOC104812970 [Tarenaya hassleriana]XP_010538714.1 PREDICTED: uncharacterized protein LOC104812970 [Tarenaya hassleriana]XP_010538715.1 PREDICTED: uncharacterized protein LOC104812970 [Tarenaya hassleriana]XP_010538716.1 PREDICTED: uncharacterized protein LOC104812970 [Tarenaya hassleriana]